MRPGNWPMESDTLAGHPHQREELYQESVKLGVPTEINSKGQPILRDPAHRRAYARALGYHDRNGGYSDP